MTKAIAAVGLLSLLVVACGSPGGPVADAGAGGAGGWNDASPDISPDRGADAQDAGAADAAAEEAAMPGGYTLPSFDGGFDFFLSLPPTFSPFLPLHGDEATREPPGFHDMSSDHYFSYEFLWWLTERPEAPDLSTAALRDDLASYFTGLCAAASPAMVTLDDPSADAGTAADAGALGARRSGTLVAGSCFGAAVPAATLEVSTYACPDHAAVLVMVSPQPAASTVWDDLRGVRDGLVCW